MTSAAVWVIDYSSRSLTMTSMALSRPDILWLLRNSSSFVDQFAGKTSIHLKITRNKCINRMLFLHLRPDIAASFQTAPFILRARNMPGLRPITETRRGWISIPIHFRDALPADGGRAGKRAAMQPDIEAYLAEIETVEETHARKIEVIHSLWTLCQTAMDQALAEAETELRESAGGLPDSPSSVDRVDCPEPTQSRQNALSTETESDEDDGKEAP